MVERAAVRRRVASRHVPPLGRRRLGVPARRSRSVPRAGTNAWVRPGLATGLALLVASLAGCKGGASITVDSSVPTPLVNPIEAAMGVYFDDSLVSYVHEEELEEYGAYRIDIGASQAPVFARVFDAMFKDVIRVERAEDPASPATAAASPANATPTPDSAEETAEPAANVPVNFVGANGGVPTVDGYIAPSIEEVQFAIPDQTGGDFYEVWIRYKLTLFDGGGKRLGEWPLIGYGKANERNFGHLGQQTPALHEATTWALRDAAAVLAFQFRSQREVQDWLAAIGAPSGDQGTVP